MLTAEPDTAAASPVPADGALTELERRLNRRERELRAIRSITRAMHARTNLDELERQALDVAIETVDATGGTIYLHDPRKSVLVFRYVVGATPEITRKLQGMEMPDTQGIAGEVFQSGVGKVTLDVSKETSHNSSVDRGTSFQTKSTITVPLRGMDGKSIGVLQVLNRRDGTFDTDDLEVLEILGAQAGSVLENARLYEEARRVSVMNLIGDISHDVKNLLTPVETGIQTLEFMMEQMFTDLDTSAADLPDGKKEAVDWAVSGVREFYKEAVDMVVEGARDAQERVREIADAIKGVISEPHFEMSDFRERAEAVGKVLKLVAERRDITIDLSGLQDTGPVELDRKGIYNALYNLVNNAIPETPEGGMIRILSRCQEQSGIDGIEIQVQDTGKGMPDHVRERMFTDNAVSTKPGGTGLGTRIVKNVVDSHHGSIRVDSEAGKGTTFTIWIPRRQADVRQ